MTVKHRRVIAFPGQGAQRKGMGAEQFDRYPDVERQASEISGISLRRLCLQDPDGMLSQTRYTQPALFVVNALHYMAIHEDNPIYEPVVFLGHSLGEYNALVAAGMITFTEGLRLVCARAQAMSEVSGGMSAVVGLNEEAVQWALSTEGIDAIDIANINTPEQIVIAGPKDALAAAAKPLLAAGAKLVKPLAVSGPFHSRYMTPARHAVTPLIEATAFAETPHQVISNATARPYNIDVAATLLSLQIDSPVRWAQSVYRFLFRSDIVFEEVGGVTLTRMNAQIERNLAVQGFALAKESA